MALDTRGLASGFAQGFGLMDAYYNRQAQNERADKRLGLQEENFNLQKQKLQGDQTKEKATFVLGKIAQGIEPTEDEFVWLQDHPQFWPALDPRTDKSIEVAQSVIDPESPMGANDPEAIEAMNQLWGHRINRGEGGRKRIAGLYPGQQPGTVALDLEIEKEDGTKYNAPMTKNRGVEGDDEVLQTPVEALVKQVQGYRMLRNAFRTPEAQATANKVLAALNGKQPQQEKPMIVNNKLVDPRTGEIIGDYSDQNNAQYGEPFEHPQLGWVQPGPDGKLIQLKTPDGNENGDWRRLSDGSLYNQKTGETRKVEGAAPNDGTGGLSSSVISQIQQTARNFHGSFNPDGSFLGIPEGAREKYTEAMERAQKLVAKGVPVFEATNLANLSVSDELSPEEAKRIAEQEADQEITGWSKGDEREDYVQRRTQELIQESRQAKQKYEQIVGGGNANQGGQLAGNVDLQAAKKIRAAYKSGQMTREQAVAELRKLGLQ